MFHDDLAYKSYCVLKKMPLNALQKDLRIQFCKKYLAWNEKQWKTVLWSDETTFPVTGMPSSCVFCRKGSNPLDPKFSFKFVKHSASLMVWGCLICHGVGEFVILPQDNKVN